MSENFGVTKRFEDLGFWKKARDLASVVYKTFGNSNDFGFKSQIQRAAISISNNIAEGFERQTNKELRQFLYIAKGSCGEVRSMLYVGKDLGYIDAKIFQELYDTSVEISKMLSGYITTIKD